MFTICAERNQTSARTETLFWWRYSWKGGLAHLNLVSVFDCMEKQITHHERWYVGYILKSSAKEAMELPAFPEVSQYKHRFLICNKSPIQLYWVCVARFW